MATAALRIHPAQAAAHPNEASAPRTLKGSTPRREMYTGVHKGLRAFMADVLVAVGRMDPHDDEEVTQTAARVRALLHICRIHLHEENRHIHPAMESRRPGSSATTAGEHLEHEEAFERLEAGVRALLGANGPERDAAAQGLYRGIALFLAENLAHMHVEETANQATLWATHSDEEIAAITRSIIASIAPADMAVFMRWMVPAMAPAERAGMLAEMRQGAPREVFEGVLALVRPHLSQREWAKLTRAL
jgi:hypothetical protein